MALDLEKFLKGGQAAQRAIDEALAVHGRELGGAPKQAAKVVRCGAALGMQRCNLPLGHGGTCEGPI